MNISIKSIKNHLRSAVCQVSEHSELYVKNPGVDFSRNRKISFSKMLFSLLAIGGKTLKCELMDIFDFDTNMPTASAFVQQRNKISSSAFESVFNTFTQSFNNLPLYKGFRLLAVDGTALRVPTNDKETLSFYQGSQFQKSYNMLHLTALFDLNSKLYTDAVAYPSRAGDERSAFNDMVDRDPCNVVTVYIADRGFESYNTMAHVQKKGQFFLFRIQDASQNCIAKGLELPNDDVFDVSFSKILTRSSSKTILSEPNFKVLSSSHKFDFLPVKFNKDDDNSFFTLNFRVVRVKLSDDKYETLITNLPEDSFPADELKKLYAMRWGIETSFRDLKYTVGLLYFHSKKTENIYQEIFAKLTMYNFVELIISGVTIPKKHRKYPYKANFSAAVHICSQYLLKNISPPKVEALILKNILPVKPPTSFPRKLVSKPSVYFTYRIA